MISFFCSLLLFSFPFIPKSYSTPSSGLNININQPLQGTHKLVQECNSLEILLDKTDEIKAAQLQKCQVLRSLAKSDQLESFDVAETMKSSTNKKITCRKFANFTVDYDSCLTILNLYDGIKVTEQGLQLVQAFYKNKKAKEINETLEKMQGQEDLQIKSIETQVESLKQKKKHADQVMAASKTALLALTAAIPAMPTQKKVTSTCMADNYENSSSCDATVRSFSHLIIPNLDNRPILLAEILTYQKQINEVHNTIMELKRQITALNDMKTTLVDASNMGEENIAIVDVCEFNPQDLSCLSDIERKSVGLANNLQGSQIQGVNPMQLAKPQGNFQTSTFNHQDHENDENDGIDEMSDSGADNIADVTNPIDEVAKADEILNPAAPAQVSPGSGGGGGGQSGGAGMGGGGGSAPSPSSNNSAAQQPEQEKDVKVTEVKSAGGKKKKRPFSYKNINAKKSKVKNPFASLFDEKKSLNKSEQGGVELERNIATDDLANKNSKLFKKISSRYKKIAADKRIEAINLDYLKE